MSYGEFELIEKIRAGFPQFYAGNVGIGDDAAVIASKGHDCKKTLITTDALVEGVHFLPGKISFFDLGYKSMAVNISDIAAMGGSPEFALLTLGISGSINGGQLDEFLKGVESARNEFRFDIVGGDTVRSGLFFVSVTMTGEAFREPLLRSGAKTGDYVYVSGTVGDSALGLGYILGNLKYRLKDAAYFTKRHCHPSPRVDMIGYLAGNYDIRSCIDISDGLLGDLNHIGEMSGAGFEINLGDLPVSADKIGAAFKEDERYFLELGLSGGEDYELVFTSPDKIDGTAVYEKTGASVTNIGRVTGNETVVYYKGGRLDLSATRKSFSHF